MGTLLGDLRFGVRNLARAPGFTTAAVLALALGIGLTTAIFSIVNGVVLRPLPYADPSRLVTIWEVNHEKGLGHENLSPVNFLDYRALTQTFDDAAAWWRPEVTLRDEARDPVRVNTVEVSANFLDVLGVGPISGAGFPKGALHAADRMVLVSERLWRARYNADPALVGRTLRLNDDDFTIAGVMPVGFHFPGDTDVWERLNWDLSRHSRGAHFMESVARLRPGVTVPQAQRELDALTKRLAGEFPGTNRGWTTTVIGLHDEIVGRVRPALLVLLAAVGLLLLIACINVASLLLARVSARSREIALRTAIGATRGRIVRQLLTESLLLAAAGGILGILLATAAVKAIVVMTPVPVARLELAAVDVRVLLFALLVVLATAGTFGLVPALLMSRTDPQQALKEGGRTPGAGRTHGRLHRALVTAEITLAVMLLSGAGLLARSVSRLSSEDPGFRSAGVMTTDLQLNGAAYARWPQVAQFYVTFLDELRRAPGVRAAGASTFLPLAPGWRIPFLVRGTAPPARGEEPMAQYHTVSDGYFESLGVSLVSGRLFDVHDTADSRGVVVVNEALARRYFAGRDPVGHTIASLTTNIGPLGASLMQDRDHVVIGVVRDVRNSSLQDAAEPAMYHAMQQFPFRHMFISVRGDSQEAVAAAIRDTVRRVAPGMPTPTLRSMDAVIGESVVRPRFLTFLLALFAAAAIALAALGVYGLLAYAVAERRQELSIRLALGARPAGLLWLVMRQGLIMAVIGCAAGAAGAWGVARSMSSWLYGVPPGDPLTMTAVSGIALSVALIACAVPAWRASRVDPAQGLR